MTVGLLQRGRDPRLDEILASSRVVGDRLEEVARRLEEAVERLEDEVERPQGNGRD